MIQRLFEAILRPVFKLVGDLMRGLFVAPFKALLGVEDAAEDAVEDEVGDADDEVDDEGQTPLLTTKDPESHLDAKR